MLYRYTFTNFQSFREQTEVSWLLDRKVPANIWSSQSGTGERVSSVMAVLGANASGKTALLKPILFVHWFLSQSFAIDPSLILVIG
jgi:hypothetical protein